MKTKINILAKFAIAIVALASFSHALATQKIDIKRGKDVPEAARNAKIVETFKASEKAKQSYRDRKARSKERGLDYVEDHYIVRFKDSAFPYAITTKRQGKKLDSRRVLQVVSSEGVSLQEVAQVLVESAGGELIAVYDSTIQGFAAYLPKKGVAKLRKDPLIDSIEKDIIMEQFTEWGQDRIDQNDLPLNSNYHPAKTGAGVHVYVIDSGLRSTHNEFDGRVGNGHFAPSFTSTDDDTSHGTSVAAVAIGDTVGVAPQATIHPVKINDATTFTATDIIDGIEWVEDNAITPAVANLSFGAISTITSVDNAVQSLINAGIPTVLAAGNDAINVSSVTPARVSDGITVAATAQTDSFATSYSNFGSGIDILAPGSAVRSAGNDSDSDFDTLYGTSFAAPHVTGAVALFLQDSPNATVAQVRAHLMQNAVSNTITSVPSGTTNTFLNVVHAGIIPPPAPSNVVLALSVPNFTITWNDDAINETAYVIERSTNLVNWTTYDTLFANSESFGDTLPGGTSFFRIRANSHVGLGAFTVASTSGSPPPGSSQISSFDGSGDPIHSSYSRTVSVPTGAVVDGYALAITNVSSAFALATVSGPGVSRYAESSSSTGGGAVHKPFSGASAGTYNLYAEHYANSPWDYAEGEVRIEW